MTLSDFHSRLGELLYIEDYGMVDVILASIVSNSLQIGDPVWLTLIGPSSGGKSQLIRPFALGNPEFIHRIDDLTPNTLLSGTMGLEGSLLGRIGKKGIISMDDLTVLFSKNAEQRGEILAQFRMIYDGYFSKSSGNRAQAIEWNGYVGMIAGATPSIYRYFSEVADMGERFISYRMKGINVERAVEFVSSHPHTSKNLNGSIGDLIKEFLPPLLQSLPDKRYLPKLHQQTLDTIRDVSEHMTLLRTPVHVNERTGYVDEFPEPEMPFRVMKQLTYLAQGMQCIAPNPHEPLPEHMTRALEWTAYSLANDKRRAYLRATVALARQGKPITNRALSSITGMHSDVVHLGMSHLQAIGIVSWASDGYKKEWEIQNTRMAELVGRLDPYVVDESTLLQARMEDDI